MTDDESVGLSSMFVQDDDVSLVLFDGHVQHVLYHVGSSVYPSRVRNHHAHLLQKLLQSRRRLSTCRYHHSSLALVVVLIVDMAASHQRVHVVSLQLFAQCLLLSEQLRVHSSIIY